MSAPLSPAPGQPAYIIVVGNEKGGSGKTTTSMHVIVALLRLGFRVASIDLDSRQRSLTRYLENRKQSLEKGQMPLPMPHHMVIAKSALPTVRQAEEEEQARFEKALGELLPAHDFLVIDSPGSDTYLSRLAHACANTVVTPINDSFVDLDVLALIDGQSLKILRPSIYSEMMWQQKLARAKRDGGSVDWIVMRNRLSNLDAKNKRAMTEMLDQLAKRIAFRPLAGFSERVIFREMFLQGLTVLDVMEQGAGVTLSLSHIAARQEIRELLKALAIPALDARLNAQPEAAGEQETAAA